MSTPRMWPREVDERMLQLSRQGWTCRRIAELLEIPKSTLSARLRLLNAEPADAENGVLLHRSGKSFTPKEDKRLLALFAEGRKAREIGAELGRSSASIHARRYWLETYRPGTATPAPDSSASPEPRQKKPAPVSYAATIPCLCCGRRFASWDRRKNRLCQTCRKRDDATSGLDSHSLTL